MNDLETNIYKDLSILCSEYRQTQHDCYDYDRLIDYLILIDSPSKSIFNTSSKKKIKLIYYIKTQGFKNETK